MIIRTQQLMRMLGVSAGVTLGCDSPTTTSRAPDDDQEVSALPDPVDSPVMPDPAETPVDPAQAVARIDQNLETLRALELFEVGELMVMSPTSGGTCYGVPCPDEVDAVRERLAGELDRLVALSVDLPASAASCDRELVARDAEAHLQTLARLHVVEIGAFLAVAPANNALCYNLPCQEDVAAADAANCDKLGRLGALASRAATAFESEAVEPPSAFVARVDENLDHLARLEVFEVGALIVGATVENRSCYVCPPSVQDEATAATRLDALRVQTAATIGAYRQWELPTAGCDLSDAQADLDALAALSIVEVGALIARDPAAEGLCYAGACSEADHATAHALACRRAEALSELIPSLYGL